MTDPETEFGEKAGRAAILAARAQEVADQIIGTARMIDEVASQAEIDDPEFMSELQLLAFECDCCGWWHSTEELNNDEGQEYDEMCDECTDCCEP